jgi:hypothetical protein
MTVNRQHEWTKWQYSLYDGSKDECLHNDCRKMTRLNDC